MTATGVVMVMAPTSVLAICPETKVNTPEVRPIADLPDWVPGS